MTTATLQTLWHRVASGDLRAAERLIEHLTDCEALAVLCDLLQPYHHNAALRAISRRAAAQLPEVYR